MARSTSGEMGLAQSAEVAATTGLLNPAAPWTLYVSPQGCVAWFERAYGMLLGTLGGPAMTIPPFPAGPPLGFSMNVVDGQFQGELVVPAKMLEDLAAYIKKTME